MILITGATGFVGRSVLAQLLSRHGRKAVLAYTSRPIGEGLYVLHHGYTNEPDFFQKSGYGDIHTIVHIGAYIPKNGSEANLAFPCNRNIIATDNLLRSDLPKLRRIVYVSTVDVYGPAAPISESSILAPSTLYGWSKLYCEKMIENWAEEQGVERVILRVGHVYGPGEEAFEKMIPVALRNILHDRPVTIFGRGDDVRTYIYVDDLARAIVQATVLDAGLSPLNVVGSEPVSIAELVRLMGELSGRPLRIERVPFDAPARHLVFDNAKFKRAMTISETPLRTGLLRELDYMRGLDR